MKIETVENLIHFHFGGRVSSKQEKISADIAFELEKKFESKKEYIQ
jgi:hypothetical protein